MSKYDCTYKDTWITREVRLKELGMTYPEFLNSPMWRATIKKADSRIQYSTCEFCNRKREELHHANYKWLGTKNELSKVYAVCSEHHELVHELAKKSNLSVRLVTNYLRDPMSLRCNAEIKRYNPDFYSIFDSIIPKYSYVKTLHKALDEESLPC